MASRAKAVEATEDASGNSSQDDASVVAEVTEEVAKKKKDKKSSAFARAAASPAHLTPHAALERKRNGASGASSSGKPKSSKPEGSKKQSAKRSKAAEADADVAAAVAADPPAAAPSADSAPPGPADDGRPAPLLAKMTSAEALQHCVQLHRRLVDSADPTELVQLVEDLIQEALDGDWRAPDRLPAPVVYFANDALMMCVRAVLGRTDIEAKLKGARALFACRRAPTHAPPQLASISSSSARWTLSFCAFVRSRCRRPRWIFSCCC